MRVAMIVNSFPSLSEKFLLNQFAGLLRDGIELDVYAAVRAEDKRIHDLYFECGLDKRTVQIDIPKTLGGRLRKLPALLVRNLLRSPRNALRAFSFHKYQRAAKNLKTSYFLDAFHGKKYDVIHCQFGQNGLIGAFLKDCGFAERLVVTFHGSDITVFPKKEGFRVYDYMFSRVDAVTAGTRFTARLIRDHGCPSEKICIIPAGVLADKYREVSPEERDPNLVLSVGRLEEVKGFEYAIAAFAKIAGEYPGLRYLIAGDGSRRDSLARQIAEAGLAGRVELVGEKNDAEIRQLYETASVLIAPSVRASNGSEEGQGLVIQEAEISGIPVIAAATGGIPDGMIDGCTGFLVSEKDPEAIAAKLRFLAGNPASAREMGKKGREFALEKYDTNVLAKKIADTYSNDKTKSREVL